MITTKYGRQFTEEVPLMTNGKLNSGYSFHLYHQYSGKGKRRLKEWDFYQISNDQYVLQMTMGHVSYCGNVAATLFSLKDGTRYSVGSFPLFPKKKLNLPTNGELPHKVFYSDKKLTMCFDVAENQRKLTLTTQDNSAAVSVLLTNCGLDKHKTVVAIPFEKRGQFYLNYKENCFVANADVRFGDFSVKMTNAFGLLDWGRGVWPFKHSWTWGNGSTMIDGIPFGFNIGWGFGDTSCGTENMFFYNNKAYKLGNVTRTSNSDGSVTFRDEEGLFDMTATPLYDNFTTTKVLWVNNSCHQVFYNFSGKVIVDGNELNVPPFVAFCEDAENRW